MISFGDIAQVFDFAPWLSPIDATNPSGRELIGEPRFDALARMTQARVEVVRDPRSNAPVSRNVQPVDWAAVLAEAEALRSEGRDLRLLAIVVRAMTNERGFDGLADGLGLIARTLDAHWDTLYPSLRPGGTPREAAQRRVSALLTLQMDREGEGLLADLRARTVFMARGLGPVTGRELERASLDARAALAEAAPGMGDKERAAFVAEHEALVARVGTACAALAGQAPDEAAALAAGIARACDALGDLERVLAARLEASLPLADLARSLARQRVPLERNAIPPAAPEAPGLAETAPVLGGGASLAPGTIPAAPAPAAPAVPGRIATRQEVVACLDRIIEFYDRTEPASPVPFLARRMRRMVPMDFLELMEDLAPSGLKEFRSLAGLSDDKKSSKS